MKRPRTDYIILHTAAWQGDPSVEDIRRVHVDENGWDDIGYHFVVRKDGSVERGRAELDIGAHCRSSKMNYKSIGICMSGDHDTETLKGKQRFGVFKLLMELCEKYGIHADNVLGHREAGANKSCPGQKVNMQQIRDSLHTLTYKPVRVDVPELATTNNPDAATFPDPLPTPEQLELADWEDDSWFEDFIAGENSAGKWGSRIKDWTKHLFGPLGYAVDAVTDEIGDSFKNKPATMKNVKRNETLSDKIIRFLKQKSTQRGLIALLSIAGITVSPDLIQEIVAVAAGVWSVVEIITDDEK